MRKWNRKKMFGAEEILDRIAPGEEKMKLAELEDGDITFADFLSWNEEFYDIE